MTQLANERPRFTDIFVQRPIVAIVISLIFVLLGLRATNILPVLQFPKIESTTLQIRTAYVGASAELVQGFITDPIERAASSIPGVDFIDSNTTAGFSQVNVWLKMNENSTTALAELSSKLDQIRYELPQGAQDPSIQVVRADRPHAAFYLSVPIAEHTTRAKVSDFLRRHVNPSIISIPGVQRVGIEGGRYPAMRIWLDPQRMAMFNVSAQDIEQALTRNNVIATIGRSENESRRMDLLVNTALQSVEDFERMVILESEDALIRISDIARVELGEEEGSGTTGYGEGASVFLSVWPLPGANEIAIADKMYVVLDEMAQTLPDGIEISVAYDATVNMRASLREIFITLAETILLVGLVVVLFMGSFRTALVPLITIPISILGAVFVMTLMGFTLNLLTVLAVVLCVGLVVDDAIVVVENVARFMRGGMTRYQAALASSRQLFSPIIGMTLTLAAVYAPIGFLTGLTGVLFKEFAFTLAVAVLISGIVALTLSPVMSAYVCADNGHEGRFTDYINSLFERIKIVYGRWLEKSLAYTPQVLFIGLFIALLTVPFFMYSKKELAPIEDEGQIIVILNAPPEASPDYTQKYTDEVVDAMGSLPDTEDMWRVTFSANGFGGQHFKKFEERDFTMEEVLPQVYGKLSQITGVQALPILPPSLPRPGNFDVEVVILSSDKLEDMLPYAEQLVNAAFETGKFMFADSDLRIDLPQGQLSLDRERVADLGMTLSDVSRQISFLMSGNFINRFNHEGKSAQVIPMIEKSGRSEAEALLDLQIRTPGNDLVPLSALVTLEKKPAPRALGKFQQKNAFKIFGGVSPGVTKEEALSALEAAAAEILPPEYTIDYVGESRQLRQQGTTLMGVLGFALVFVFFVLAIQFNSFRDPLVILLGSVPLALAGAMLFTFLDLTTINIFSQVGFITLVGLVAKNAILIVEFAKQLQESGLSKYEAIHQAAMVRLRPVLMTTGATVLGHFPLVLVVGAGAEARNSIGIVLVAGMLVGTLFTLFILPSVYMVLGVEHKEEHFPKEAAAIS